MGWMEIQWLREFLERRGIAKKIQSLDKLKKERERLSNATREKKRT